MTAGTMLLLTRAEDFIRVAVQWTDSTVEAHAGAAVILVAGDGATLTLVFPPQAIAEQSLDGVGLAGSRQSGTSRLCFALPTGTRIPLSTEGVLSALLDCALVPADDASDATGTLLELPAGLVMTPATDDVTAIAGGAPVVGATGATGLWQIALRAVNGPVSLRPLRADNLGLGSPVALDDTRRRAIAAAGQDVEANVTLSALGATFDAELVTDALGWSHRSAQGRDQRVTLVEKGVLYPLGHRATFVTTSERMIADAAGAPAALKTDTYLIVTEPVRRTSAPDFRFEEVEIQTRKLRFATSLFPELRPTPPLDLPEQHEADALGDQLDQGRARIEEIQQGLAAPLANLANLGVSEAAEYEELGISIDEWTTELDNPTGDEDPSGVAAVRAQLKAAIARQKVLWPIIKAAIASFQAELKQLAAADRDLTQRLNDLSARIKQITDVLSQPPTISFWPGDANGVPLKFDVRLATPRGDLNVRMPLVFVKDFATLGDPIWPDYASLTDPSTISTLRSHWRGNGGGEVALAGGVAFDLVQDAVPQPGDVHEIHKLAIEAGAIIGSFAPQIARIDAKIAALRALLPDQDKIVSLAYNKAADAVKSPLLPLVPIGVDFLAHADRSGGLVAPKFEAQALSRTLGPVARAVLDEVNPPDFTALYKDTRLLGLSLGELIDAAKASVTIPSGPTIVPVLDGVRPIGVRLEWMNVPLKGAGIFRPLLGDPDPAGPCELDMQVRIVGEDSVTSATIRNFALALPATDTLVTVSFRSLQMVQAKGKPPAVHVDHFSLDLSGALELLHQLQEEVLRYFGARDPGIVVRRTATGIAAAYAFALPEVAAGVFLMRNLGVSIDIDVPFNGDPVAITLGFARADNPFVLAVTIFGGGGYLLIKMARGAVDSVDLSLMFGAFVSVSFLIAKGEVHAYGMVRLTSGGHGVALVAQLRLGGSIDVLGLVSVAIELVLALEYQPQDNILVGQATLVIEVHLLFFTRSVKLDSGKWILAGSKSGAERLAHSIANQPLQPADAEREWRNYWQAFSTWTD